MLIFYNSCYCVLPENIPIPPTEVIGISWGGGGGWGFFLAQKSKEMYFRRGGEGYEYFVCTFYI